MTVHASTPSSGYPPAHGTRGDAVLAPRALTYLNVREGATTILVTTALAVAIAFLPDPGWRT
ncbi:hypothetical protein, partial [Streptomyces sp. GbtcB7]|uniref:hypothetical protein n=1 Tax=Streptomyces sp. GbtcB7 TaxID=2824752 RepID=UPI001C2F922D